MARLPGLSFKMPRPKAFSGSQTKIPGFNVKIPKAPGVKAFKMPKFNPAKVASYSNLTSRMKALTPKAPKGLNAIIKDKVKALKGL